MAFLERGDGRRLHVGHLEAISAVVGEGKRQRQFRQVGCRKHNALESIVGHLVQADIHDSGSFNGLPCPGAQIEVARRVQPVHADSFHFLPLQIVGKSHVDFHQRQLVRKLQSQPRRQFGCRPIFRLRIHQVVLRDAVFLIPDFHTIQIILKDVGIVGIAGKHVHVSFRKRDAHSGGREVGRRSAFRRNEPDVPSALYGLVVGSSLHEHSYRVVRIPFAGCVVEARGEPVAFRLNPFQRVRQAGSKSVFSFVASRCQCAGHCKKEKMFQFHGNIRLKMFVNQYSDSPRRSRKSRATLKRNAPAFFLKSGRLL